MIPIDKGNTPLDENDKEVSFTEYKYWRKHLISRLGAYCSYCNAPLQNSPQVEHISPINPAGEMQGGDVLAWENILLACGPCNRSKTNITFDPAVYYYPHLHNPVLVLQSQAINDDARIMTPKTGLQKEQIKKAEATISLLDLANVDGRNDVVDMRWSFRQKTFLSIQGIREIYQVLKANSIYDPDRHPKLVTTVVFKIFEATGFFSLAFEIFADSPEVLIELIKVITGLNKRAFDQVGNPIPLNPANLIDPI